MSYIKLEKTQIIFLFTIVKIIHTLQLLEDVLDQFGDHQKVFKIHTLFPIFLEDMFDQL